VLDPSRAHRELGWKAELGLDRGLEVTLGSAS
jgi:nucleoside-diphosphate-sugar epimerase